VDADLATMKPAELAAEVQRLRDGIRMHRDTTMHELCWHQPELWGLLPEQIDPLPAVPTWSEFLLGCVHYRKSLDEQLPDALRSSRPYDG